MQTKLQQQCLDLTFLSLSVIQKDEFLQKLKLNLINFSEKHPQNNAVKKLIHSIHLSDLRKKDWEIFKSSFEQVFPAFFNNLHSLYPQLTAKELRHCALIRLNIPPFDCAQIMGISLESIHKARHRLRKKIGLNRKEQLEGFLLSLTEE